MKKILSITFVMSLLLCVSLTTKAQNQDIDFGATQLGSNVKQLNYPIYLLLGNFDYVDTYERGHGWGRGYRPRPPREDNLGREIHREYGFTTDLLDGMYNVLGNGRRTKTCDIRTEEDLNKFLKNNNEEVYAIEGKIDKMESATRYENNRSNRVSYIEGRVQIRFKVRDLRTNKIVHTFIKECTGTSSVRPSISEAMDRAIDNLCKRLVVELNDVFPIYGNVVKIDEVKKDKVKSLYVDLGIQDKVAPGSHFTIYSVETISGMEIRKKLGKVKVGEQQGYEISQCKVTSGGAEILAASNVGHRMVAISYTGFWE